MSVNLTNITTILGLIVAIFAISKIVWNYYKNPKKLRVLFTGDLSGSDKVWGRGIWEGMKDFLNEDDNKKIEIGDKEFIIDIKKFDDKGDIEIAQKIPKKFLGVFRLRKKPFAIVGPISSECTKASLPRYLEYYKTESVIHLLPVSTSAVLVDKNVKISSNVFRMPPSNEIQARLIVKILSRNKWDPWGLYILHPGGNEKYLTDLQFQIERTIKENRLSSPIIEGFNSNDEFEQQELSNLINSDHLKAMVVIGKWKDQNPNVPAVQRFISHCRVLELRENAQKKIPIILPDWPMPDVAISSGLQLELLRKVYIMYQILPKALNGSANPSGPNAYNKIIKYYGYDSLFILKRALEQSGSTDMGKIVKLITSGYDFDGKAQKYSYLIDSIENKKGEYHLYDLVSNNEIQIGHSKECYCKDRN